MAFADGIADFRSDTVTRPTPEMRRAMADAEVGDDVYGEDPTINLLQDEAAEAVGMEAALFVPSGSMGNQVAINVHTRPGDEVLCVDWAHVRNYEHGAGAAMSGVAFRNVATAGGVITVDDIAKATAEAGYHLPAISLLVWENTHNVSGGTVVPLEAMAAGSEAARAAGLSVHLDGARMWNAAVALGVDGPALTASVDSVMFCFSKGLGAPVGSIVCGSQEFIVAAHERRKRFGGGMRQAGVLAAAARIGLRDRGRLEADHALAADLGRRLSERFPKAVDEVSTNMVVVDEAGLPFSGEQLRDRLEAVGVRVGFIKPGVLRFVTHRDVTAADVDRVLGVVDATP